MALISHPSVNKEFLERVLSKSIKSLKITGGSRPGDNFTSILFSIEVITQEGEKLDLLMKTYPNHPARQKFLEITNLFMRELLVYKTLIPEYLKFQEQAGVKIILKPAFPTFIDGRAVDYDVEKETEMSYGVRPEIERLLYSEDVENYILMVDVRKTMGFKMADKSVGLDFDHCKLVLPELAKLHALSRAYKKHRGIQNLTDKFPFFVDSIFNGEGITVLEPMIKNNFSLVSEIVEGHDLAKKHERLDKSISLLEAKWMDVFSIFLSPEGVDELEAAKLMRIKPETNGITPEDQWVVGSPFGDCWINNMLFKYDKNDKPVQTILVDLQICREACLTVDLAYFFYNSTDHTLRKEHLDRLLEVYYESFLTYCKILNIEPFPGFSLKNLIARFHRSKILGFVFSVLLLPVILQNPETSVDLDSVTSEQTGNSAADISDLIQTSRKTESDEKLLEGRLLGMINELIEQGVL